MNARVPPVAEGTTNPVGPLLRGAAVPALGAVAVLTLVALFSSPSAAMSVLVGGTMALVALAVGPLLHQLCRNLDPNLVLGLVVFAYCTVIVLLGIGYALVNDASWLVGGFAGGGVFVVAAAWTIGQMRAASKLRQPLYLDEERTAGR